MIVPSLAKEWMCLIRIALNVLTGAGGAHHPYSSRTIRTIRAPRAVHLRLHRGAYGPAALCRRHCECAVCLRRPLLSVAGRGVLRRHAGGQGGGSDRGASYRGRGRAGCLPPVNHECDLQLYDFDHGREQGYTIAAPPTASCGRPY